jgi:hypothetical protein
VAVACAVITSFLLSIYTHTVDIDEDYSPENCRWITKKTNIRNRDLFWSEELDGQVVLKAKELGIDPYELIERAVREYLQNCKEVTALCL